MLHLSLHHRFPTTEYSLHYNTLLIELYPITQRTVCGGHGKLGETIRPAANPAEQEQRSGTVSGTVTIHHLQTEGPSVKATSGRGTRACVTFIDVHLVRF